MIPQWNSAGVIPPIRPGQPGQSADRSPYATSLCTFVERFATSPERVNVMEGLLNFRSELHKQGLTSGFQWLDGSFLEEIEVLENRAPRDVDVVTFFALPEGTDQTSLYHGASQLFDHDHVKQTFSVDSYFTALGTPADPWYIKNIAYWYSMWSHRRDGLWKGFIQVDLNPTEDEEARTVLDANKGEHHA